jgi:2-oxoglutarate dehydrogenase E2 component (dihydrolipoamide succinyltransferase)
MKTDVLMPQMGESIVEGTITRWLKNAGERVEKDEPLFEISTDKVDAEIPAPQAGVLAEIRCAEGDVVQVNAVVAVIADIADAQDSPTEQKSDDPKVTEALAAKTSAKDKGAAQTVVARGVNVLMPQMGESIVEGTITRWLKKAGERVEKDEPLFEISTDKVDAEIPAPRAGVLAEIRCAEGDVVQVNAVVAVISEGAPESAQPPIENAIHSHAAPVFGSGTSGRMLKNDVLRHEEGKGGKPGSRVHDLRGEVVPLSRMRAIIAQRMVESNQMSPHVHTAYKVDMTRVVNVREREKAAFEQREGFKLTYMPFIATAVLAALGKHPIINASLMEQAIHYHSEVNLGIAVALEAGLIVPVVHGAGQLSFVDLARRIADLAARARARKLNPDEAAGSTFTITNSGIFGDEFTTPIINQPDSAILCVSGLKKEPVVFTDADGTDRIAIRSMQYLTLGFDHRLIDGADACKFMLDVKGQLEKWESLA